MTNSTNYWRKLSKYKLIMSRIAKISTKIGIFLRAKIKPGILSILKPINYNKHDLPTFQNTARKQQILQLFRPTSNLLRQLRNKLMKWSKLLRRRPKNKFGSKLLIDTEEMISCWFTELQIREDRTDFLKKLKGQFIRKLKGSCRSRDVFCQMMR